MAYTVTRTKSTFGNKKVIAMKIVADAATQNVETGLKNIEWHSLAPASLSTAAIKLYINSLTTGTAAAGYLAISGCTSGDEFYVTVYGR